MDGRDKKETRYERTECSVKESNGSVGRIGLYGLTEWSLVGTNRTNSQFPFREIARVEYTPAYAKEIKEYWLWVLGNVVVSRRAGSYPLSASTGRGSLAGGSRW
jgi:hypothetical protein